MSKGEKTRFVSAEKALKEYLARKDVKERFYWRGLSKAGKLKPVPSLCMWLDISGVASKLGEGGWDLNSASAKELFWTLSRVYETAARPRLFGDYFQSECILVLNDGIARVLDVPEPSIDPREFASYLRDMLFCHYHVVSMLLIDSIGLGVRSVLAGGERVQYTPPKITGYSVIRYQGKPTDWAKQVLKQEYVYHPVQFQMNTAFSRAYIIESAGKDQGIEVNHIYIEETCINILRRAMPNCIHVKRDKFGGKIYIKWNNKPLLHMSYDTTLNIKKESLKSRVYRLSDFVVHEALEGEETEIPLKPDEIEQLFKGREYIVL